MSRLFFNRRITTFVSRAFLIFTYLSIAYSSQAMATPYKDRISHQNNKVLSISSGWNWMQVDNTDIIISPFETDSVKVNSVNNQAAWNIGLGQYLLENALQHRHFLTSLFLELNAYYTAADAKGIVWQYELPQFNNYYFKAAINSTRMMIDAKPGLFHWHGITPYAVVGIGAAMNHVIYKESVAASDANPASIIKLHNNLTAHFAYEVGAGLQYNLNDDWAIFAQYLYADLGNATGGELAVSNVRMDKSPTFDITTQSALLGLSLKI